VSSSLNKILGTDPFTGSSARGTTASDWRVDQTCPRLAAQCEAAFPVRHAQPVWLVPGTFFRTGICLNQTTRRRRKDEVCPTAPSGAVGMHIKPDLPCDNQLTVSEQTTTSRKGHQGVNRLTRSCHGRWRKHRTKYTYDLNGNLLSEHSLGGTNRIFSYDDENELTSVWVTNAWQSQFVYDGKMRRRIERDYSWNGSSWTQTNEIHFIYDGNVVIQERDINNLPKVTYTRTGGSLLARSDNTQMIIGSSSAHAYYHADGNGNVTMLINSFQAVAAKYLYDSFGNTLSMSGPLAGANTYRFASKEWNDNAGLYYFGRRYYDPMLQRFVNRDPIQESGGLNLYGYCGNNPVSLIDILGLDCPPSEWNLWFLNMYNNFGQDSVNILDAVGNNVENLAEASWNMTINPVGTAVNTADNIGTQLGNASTDPMGYAQNTLNNVLNSLQTPQGIVNLTIGIELALATGGAGATADAEATAVETIAADTGLFRMGEAGSQGLPQTMETVLQHAEQGGIGFDGINVKIVPDAPPNFYGWANPNGTEIHLYPAAFTDSESLITTLGHERMHAYQFQTFGPAVNASTTSAQLFENATVQTEGSFYQYFLSNGGGQ
jgi:RHS repeat-associated protein